MPPWLAITIALVGAIPGILGLGGSFVWIGRTNQRLSQVEQDLRDLKDIGKEVATISERTKNTAEGVAQQAGDLRRITDHFLDESRSFARQIVRDHAPGRA